MANEQISISRETLRAELGELELRLSGALTQLELRLIDRLADKTELAAAEARITSIERMGVMKDGPIAGDVATLRQRVHDVENVSAARALLVDEFRKSQTTLESLVGWRNKLGGGVAVATFLGAATALRVFFGVG